MKPKFTPVNARTDLQERLRVRRWYSLRGESRSYVDGRLVAFIAQPFADNTTEILGVVLRDDGSFEAAALPYIEALERCKAH